MQKTKKANFLAYAALPLMTIVLYTIASLFFILVFKEISTVIFFATLASIFIIAMILYAILPYRAKNAIRIISIFLISLLLFGLGCILGRQNFQLEGFFFYALTGTFGGVIIHFLMGKIIGPVLTGRLWCGWGCWTMMLMELLPFRESKGWKKGSLKKLKYIHFALSLGLVAILVFVFKYFIHDPNQSPDQPGTVAALYWFLIGNGFYYAAGIILAITLKDNRAFCKYLCPVSIFLKLSNTISLMRIKGNKDKCTQCKTCVEKCPFNIKIDEYIAEGMRVKSSECVMCMKCISVCPEGVLKASVGFDLVKKDKLKEV